MKKNKHKKRKSAVFVGCLLFFMFMIFDGIIVPWLISNDVIPLVWDIVAVIVFCCLFAWALSIGTKFMSKNL